MNQARTIGTSPEAALDRAACPPWCEQEHLGRAEDVRGFHHDGEVTSFDLEQVAAPDHGAELLIQVSRHEQAGLPAEASHVEVQNEFHTLFVLTPFECLKVARALLECAAVVSGELSSDRDYDHQLHQLVADMLDGLGQPSTELDLARADESAVG